MAVRVLLGIMHVFVPPFRLKTLSWFFHLIASIPNLQFPFNITHHGLSKLVATDIGGCRFEHIQHTNTPGLPSVTLNKFIYLPLVVPQNW